MTKRKVHERSKAQVYSTKVGQTLRTLRGAKGALGHHLSWPNILDEHEQALLKDAINKIAMADESFVERYPTVLEQITSKQKESKE